ncbi:MAG: methyltransferase domain-containing protein [Lewinellaceae bacterium]|nr:methyltransferase domain-containing protein [Lewinellaceae bacterium]
MELKNENTFSLHSDQYARYRPSYPDALFDFLLSLLSKKEKAWDCGTGNGQMAVRLAPHFEQVFATDISGEQLKNAISHEKIQYSRQPAERTDFPPDFFDFVVVAQAIHWFDFDRFYGEVNRILRDEGIIAVVGYDRPQISPEVDQVVTRFYRQTVGPYWDPERRYIDERYRTIPFPFHEMEAPAFSHELEWDFDHLTGYLRTWSAVKHYMRKVGEDPIGAITGELKEAWGEKPAQIVKFPIILRVGRKRNRGVF